VLLAGDAAHQQPPFIGQGMCQGIRDVANLVWKLDRVLRGQSGTTLLDSYGEERSAHVRELTTRIKAIGHVICERDPVAAEARDARILAEGNGKPRTITRQDIVPPLRRGLIATAPHAANGTLFPQPRVRTAAGPQLLDAACGAGWRLVVDGGSGLTVSPVVADQARDLGLRIIFIGTADSAATEGMVTEEDGVFACWLGRHECAAAIVRPDHYVFGVITDAHSLAAMMSELSSRLQ
jgi:3-(3-hydroxy-phenyl)propionate hydroxylase